MPKEEIIIPRWFLEIVEDTLRIQNNINLDKKTGETCQDRNIKQSLNGIRKLLNGEELTGMERLEKLHPLFSSNLNEAAEEYEKDLWLSGIHDKGYRPHEIVETFKAGAEWMTKQGYTEEGVAHLDDCEIWVNMTNTDIQDGDKVIVQIRKK